MRVAVVTPTIGSNHLDQCMESVDKQTYEDLMHYIFIDGIEHEEEIRAVTEQYGAVSHITLEDNVGKGWYGHRVYAACSYLVDADVIVYLDEDNWLEPNHIESLVKVIEAGNQWAFSLRKIYDKDGNFLLNDDCESLGKWPTWHNEEVFHIDTSSFAVTSKAAETIGQTWFGQWGADRQFFANLKHYFPKFDCTKQYTSNYRLDGNEHSVDEGFFVKGNSVMLQKYPEGFPWQK